MIRGETIQLDIALTLRPRPPTELAWHAALRILAQRTLDWKSQCAKTADWPLGFSVSSAHMGRNTVNWAISKRSGKGQKNKRS